MGRMGRMGRMGEALILGGVGRIFLSKIVLGRQK
jgi:hypothetical protein